MVLTLTDDQRDLQRLVREFLADRSPESAVRRAMDSGSGFDPGLWGALGGELGVCGLAVPRSYGGAGASMVEVGLVLEELGRALACVPYLSSVVLAQSLLLNAGDEAAARRWLPELASGARRAAVAVVESSGRWDPAAIATVAAPDGGATGGTGSWRLRGTKMFVLDGHTADTVFIAARTAAGVSLFAVDGSAENLVRTPLETMDLTRKQARLDLLDTPARLVGADGAGWETIDTVLRLAAVGLAVESTGGLRRVLEMSVEYSKVRVQFGRPTGSFQAIKHRCADMLLAVESAQSAAYHALETVEAGGDALAIASSLAHAYCQDAYFDCAAENIQVHGGIGFTWEHPAHLYFKRAQSSRLLLGDPTFHRGLVADRIGI
jgi:alkylation response protein AidB-like acyl-CoA dehydrogenase